MSSLEDLKERLGYTGIGDTSTPDYVLSDDCRSILKISTTSWSNGPDFKGTDLNIEIIPVTRAGVLGYLTGASGLTELKDVARFSKRETPGQKDISFKVSGTSGKISRWEGYVNRDSDFDAMQNELLGLGFTGIENRLSTVPSDVSIFEAIDAGEILQGRRAENEFDLIRVEMESERSESTLVSAGGLGDYLTEGQAKIRHELHIQRIAEGREPAGAIVVSEDISRLDPEERDKGYRSTETRDVFVSNSLDQVKAFIQSKLDGEEPALIVDAQLQASRHPGS